LTKIKDVQEQEAEYENRKKDFDVILQDLKKQADSLRHFIEDSIDVESQNEKLIEEKHFLNDEVIALCNSKNKMLEEHSECKQEYKMIQAKYEAMFAEKTILDDEVKYLHRQIHENAVNMQEIQNTKENLTNLNTEEITLRAHKNNLHFEIQQCIEVVRDHAERKLELEQDNMNLVSIKSENIKLLETMSLELEVNTEHKKKIDDEIKVLMIQLKDLTLSEQILIKTQEAISVLNIEVLEKKNELKLLHISQNEILLENVENSRIIDALKIEQDSLHDRNKLNENKMADLLLLIQEQQLKKQEIDDNVDNALEKFEAAVQVNNELRAEHDDILKQHNVDIESSNLRKKCLLHEMELQNIEKVNLQDNIIALKTELKAVEILFEETQNNYFLYKNKLLIVDAYAANIETVVRMISTIEDEKSDSICINHNSVILADIILCITHFLEWFESVFVYKLHHLSNLMLHSQIEH